MPAMIDTKTCTGCGRCDRSCPLDVIYYNKDEKKAEIRYPAVRNARPGPSLCVSR